MAASIIERFWLSMEAYDEFNVGFQSFKDAIKAIYPNAEFNKKIK